MSAAFLLTTLLICPQNTYPLLHFPQVPFLAKVTPSYKTYRVKKGDTLFSIAKKFYGTGHGTWRVIAQENSVTPETLRPGMVLRIPVEPAKVYGDQRENPPRSSKVLPGPTLGDTIDAVGRRVKYFLRLLGLRFDPGPTYPFQVVLAIFVACAFYVTADALMIFLGSFLLRVQEPTFNRAIKVALGSVGLQILLLLTLLMIGAVVNFMWPDTANLQNLRSLSWHARGVQLAAFLSLFLFFFFIPVTIAKQTYGITAGKAGSVIFLALVLKCFVALFPSAVAFIATGAGVS